MNLHKIAYQLLRPPPAYCKLTGQAEERDLRNDRLEHYEQLLDHRRIRKPVKLVQRIRDKISSNIYKMSLDELKRELVAENQEYEQDLIILQTDFMYQQYIQKEGIQMIKSKPMILEYDPQGLEIVNKRKMKYERVLDKTDGVKNDFRFQNTSSIFVDDQLIKLENQLNEQLKIELFNENIKFKPIGIIQEEDWRDPVNDQELQYMRQKRSTRHLESARSKGLSTFREEHINRAEIQDSETGRSEMEMLEVMLLDLFKQDPKFFSRSTVRPIKIKKDILQNLIDFQGKLKKEIIHKVLNKIKNQSPRR